MRTLKKILTVLIIITIVSSCYLTIQASANVNTSNLANLTPINGSPEYVIFNNINYINKKDWSDYTNNIILSDQNEYKDFFNNQNNTNNNIGLFNIKSASLVSLYSISLDKLVDYTDLSDYSQSSTDLVAFIEGLNYNVINDNDAYSHNGINYRLIILESIGNQWKVVEESVAPSSLICKYATNLNSNNSLVSPNSVIPPPDSIIVPKTIRVYRNATKTVDVVNFTTYCQCVLPNEWIPSWSAQSLEAGAFAVKAIGWYRVLHPKYPGLGYDIKDTTADQVYKPNSSYASTNNALSQISSQGLFDSNGCVLCAAYNAGTVGVVGNEYSGVMSQNGSEILANEGCNDYYICGYYYDMSDKSLDDVMFETVTN